jgi:sugar phosphate isomerase/epimerase
MPPSRQIALELGPFRDQLASPDGLARHLERAAEIGFRSLVLGDLGQLQPEEVRRLADAVGLKICAARGEPTAILEQPAAFAERLATLGCRLGIYSAPKQALDTQDQVFELADALSRAGEAMRTRGRLLTFRNSISVFRKLSGKAILDWLYERSDGVMLHAALDTFCVQAGGGDPAGYCARLSGRMPLLLLRDYAIAGDDQAVAAPLGWGNLSLPIILREADVGACEHYVVAHVGRNEEGVLEAARAGLRYLEQR